MYTNCIVYTYLLCIYCCALLLSIWKLFKDIFVVFVLLNTNVLYICLFMWMCDRRSCAVVAGNAHKTSTYWPLFILCSSFIHTILLLLLFLSAIHSFYLFIYLFIVMKLMIGHRVNSDDDCWSSQFVAPILLPVYVCVRMSMHDPFRLDTMMTYFTYDQSTSR